VLAVAAALLSVPEKSTVIIEEIDNGVHPSRIEMLAGRIRAVADRRQLRVILTSHNATMLDAIPPADFPSVVVCRRDPKSQATELLSLQDVRFLPQIIGHGALGQLFTQGTIERYLRAESAPRQSTGTEALLELLRST
jgi:predicted ATPase